MKTEVFRFNDYRHLMKNQLQGKNQSWGSISEMAEATTCQRSHISRVLAGTRDLSPEQALKMAKFWGWSASETEYFLLLVDYARAGTQDLKKYILEKIKRAQEAEKFLAVRTQVSHKLDEHKELTYFSAWYWSAIHMLLAIPGYQTSVAISTKLELPEALVISCLSQLEKFELAKKVGGTWQLGKGSLHLPKGSALVNMHHQNWRQRALLDAQRPESEGVHYTAVQTISRKDFEKLKEMIFELLEKYTAIAEPSKPQELVALHCDWYRL